MSLGLIRFKEGPEEPVVGGEEEEKTRGRRWKRRRLQDRRRLKRRRIILYFFASFSEIKFVLLELKICIIWNIGYAITKGRFWRCRARKK